MRDELRTAIAALLEQGLKVRVKPAGLLGDIFIVHLRDGAKYGLSAGDILRLKAKMRLSADGIQEMHRTLAGRMSSSTVRCVRARIVE